MSESPWSGSWWAVWWHNTVCPPGNSIASSPRWAPTCNRRRPACPARLGDDSLTPQTEGRDRNVTADLSILTFMHSPHTVTHKPRQHRVQRTVTFTSHCKERGITSHPACCTLITKSKSSDTILVTFSPFHPLSSQILSPSCVIHVSSSNMFCSKLLVFWTISWGRLFFNLIHNDLLLTQMFPQLVPFKSALILSEMCLRDFSNERGPCVWLTMAYMLHTFYFLLVWMICFVVSPHHPCGYLHLSVSVFVGVTTALTLPAELLELGLAALDRLRFRPPLALILLQSGLIGK